MSLTAEAGIAAQRRGWISGLNRGGDPAELGGYLTEDAVWIPLNAEAVYGREAVGAWLEPSVRTCVQHFVVAGIRLRIAGGWAVEEAAFMYHLRPGGGGSPTTRRGVYLLLWRRDEDGTWRIERYVEREADTSGRETASARPPAAAGWD